MVESYVISKINELLKSEVQKKKGLKSKQTNEKKMSKEVDIQLNLVTGEYDNYHNTAYM